MDELLTVGDVVRRWEVADTTVRRALQRGLLEGAQAPTEGREAWAIPLAAVIARYGPEPQVELDETEQLRLDLAEAKAAALRAEDELDQLRLEAKAIEEAKALEAAQHLEAKAELRGARETIQALNSAMEVAKSAADATDALKSLMPMLTALAMQAEQKTQALEVSNARRAWPWSRVRDR